MSDPVNHPAHYTSDPSGVEAIQVTRHRNFDIGNAIKYLWRLGLKEDDGRPAIDKEIEDAEKAIWYIQDHVSELRRRKGGPKVISSEPLNANKISSDKITARGSVIGLLSVDGVATPSGQNAGQEHTQ